MTQRFDVIVYYFYSEVKFQMAHISSTDELLCEEREGVLWLTLNRPQALNALTAAMVQALTATLQAAIQEPGIRAIVLTGSGRAFCAGADLKDSERRSREPGAVMAFIRAVMALVDLIENCPKPTLAAVNGTAVAGGLELILACDLVLAAESARLGDSHSNFAMFPGAGATAKLPRRIGLSEAKWLMFTGATLPAGDPIWRGLVNQVVPLEALNDEVEALARHLAAKSPLVLNRMKEALNDALEQPLAVAMRRERDLNELHSLSLDRAEGLAAFREKRTPQFSGR